MSETVIQVSVILLLILVNGFFAFSELALVSTRKERLTANYSPEDKSVKTLLRLLENPNEFLSTIQIGISLISVLSGAFGGLTLVAQVAPIFVRMGLSASLSNQLAFFLIVGLITYFSIVLGELIPKRAAMSDPERFAMLVARPIAFLSVIFRPVEKFLSASVKLGMRLFGIPIAPQQSMSMEEIKILIDQARIGGIMHAEEQEIVEGVFRFSDLYLAALITPRTEMEWIDINDPPDEIRADIRETDHSWLPVAEDNLDHVIGVLKIKEYYEHENVNSADRLREILHEPLFLPENMLAVKALTQMKSTGVVNALVLDEYGGLLGLVTLMDIFESMVGAFSDPDDIESGEVVKRVDGSLLVDGLIDIQELKLLLDLEELPEEDKVGYQTLAGFVIHQLDRIPKVGDRFEYGKYDFEVLDMDGLRVDKVLISVPNL